MKIKAIACALATFLSCVLLALVVASMASHLVAADPASPAILDAASVPLVTAPAITAPVTAPSAVVAGDFLSSIGLPSWLVTGLSIFATVSIAYQGLIAFAHKRAAETADVADDKWIASLEAQTWFRILDKVFYWGGYLGAKFGGKKL